MPIQFVCSNPDCGKKLFAPEHLAGKKVRCPACRAILTAPFPNSGGSEQGPSGKQDEKVPGATKLGDYRLIRKLGEGGMGSVYEAEHEKLGRRVALKVMDPKLTSNPVVLARFEREARSAATMSHPNMVQVYDIGQDKGTHYLAMEFIEGESLLDRIEREVKLPVNEVLDIAESVAKALKHALEHSIIHRDVKPENILISKDGVVKLADMGLAKSLEDQQGVTATGTGLGTPYYMAPEQGMDAAHVDHRVDIYALGITMLHALTGKRPYDGNSAMQIIRKHIQEELPTAMDLGAEVPQEVDELIRKMAAKDKEDRYSDYSELLADMAAVREGKAPSVVTRGQRAKTEEGTPSGEDDEGAEAPTRGKKILIGACIAILIVIAIIAFQLLW